MSEVPNPAPRQPMDDPEELNTLEDLSALMADLDASDSLGLSDSAVGLILGCVDETDSAVKAAQLEAEMVASISKLEKPAASPASPDADDGEEPPPPTP